MEYFITIDGGTTNTRLSLVGDEKLLAQRRLPFGARLGGAEPRKYRDGIRDAIAELLSENRLTEGEITRILASGMITSENGICHLPHTSLPAGIKELHATMHETVIPEISGIPFVFLRGLRTAADSLEDADMMRGEETELLGLTEHLIPSCLYVLPGSHSKLTVTDEDGRISSFTTTLTGEMLAALSAHTILSDSVTLSELPLDSKALLRGYRYASEHGLNEALFKVRILDRLLLAGKAEIYCFFLGAVLEGEIGAILARPEREVVIAGKRQIRLAMAALLRELSDKSVTVADEETVALSTVRGAIRIYKGI